MPVENSLFTWDERDGDEECSIFYGVTLTRDIGKFAAGMEFDSAFLMQSDDGPYAILQLCSEEPKVEVLGEYKIRYEVV